MISEQSFSEIDRIPGRPGGNITRLTIYNENMNLDLDVCEISVDMAQ